jgi:hypothetical protein
MSLISLRIEENYVETKTAVSCGIFTAVKMNDIVVNMAPT